MKMISIYALETAASTAAATAADGTATTANAGLVEMLGMLLPLILMFVVFYFFLIRPQKKKDKKVKDMLAALKPGDRICTIGGIYGTIKSIPRSHRVVQSERGRFFLWLQQLRPPPVPRAGVRDGDSKRF